MTSVGLGVKRENPNRTIWVIFFIYNISFVFSYVTTATSLMVATFIGDFLL